MKQEYFINIGYNQINQVKTILKVLQIDFIYYSYFYNTYNIELTATEETAKAELINILIDKVKNRYKIQLRFDNIHNSIKATLFFNHILNDGTINKYKYLYTFENIPSSINLL